MKTIIAGSRDIHDFDLVEMAVAQSGFTITEVVSGKAQGVDALGEQWAKKHNIPVKPFPARWEDLHVPNCVLRRGPRGQPINILAGLNRNTEMADYASALIAIWDGRSTGTADMIQKAKAKGLKVFVFTPSPDYVVRRNQTTVG